MGYSSHYHGHSNYSGSVEDEEERKRIARYEKEKSRRRATKIFLIIFLSILGFCLLVYILSKIIL